MNNIYISCIVPVFNSENYLEKCITSIINQTYNNFELILIDDGSTDNSGKICDKFSKTDNRITVIHQENAGVSVARNVGIINCKGYYITFIDSDDWIENNYFELIVTYLQTYNSPDLLINNFIKEKERKKEHSNSGSILLMKNQETIEQMFIKKHFSWQVVGCFYKKEICKNIHFDKEIKYGEDLLFKYQFINACNNNIVYLPLRKYHYVYNTHSACNSYDICKKADDLKVLKYILDQQNNPTGEMIYRNEYVPRLLKYYTIAIKSNSDYELKLANACKKELSCNFKKLMCDSKIKFSLKLKLIFYKLW